MENFIVSARKYRPTTFNEVVGQTAITNTLKNAIKNKHLAQAFLFTGPRGVGKTTCARVFAKTINCMNLTAAIEPCNECESCRSFNTSSSFNVHELDAASNNSVEDIRRLVEQVRIPPQVGEYKIYIIDEVHMLSQAAFNAFLKTLEEPPAYAKFILATTEKHKIIPTILSRCQIYDFNRITNKDIASHLQYVAQNESIEAEEEALHIIANKADGALRDALSIFDQMVSFSGNKITYEATIENLNVLHTEYYFKLIDYVLNGDIASTLLLYDEVISKGFEGQHFINGVAGHLRNLLVVKDPQTAELLEVAENTRNRYVEQSQYCSILFIIEALKITNEADIHYKTVIDKRVFMELNLMKLCQLSGKLPQESTSTPAPSITQHKPIAESKKTAIENPKAKEEVKATQPKVNKENTEPTPRAVESPKASLQPELKPKTPATAAPAKEELKSEEEGIKTLKKDIKKPGSFGLSIKQNIDTAREELGKSLQQDVEEVLEGEPKVRIDDDELKQAVADFAQSINESDKAFSIALSAKRISIPKSNTVHLELTNVAMDNADHKQALKNFLKEKFQNNHIIIETEIIEEEVTPKNEQMDSYQKMVKKNPLVDDIRNQLDLNF